MPPASVQDWTSKDKYGPPLGASYFSIGNDEGTINSVDPRDQTVCRPTKSYQWGFSSLLLFIFGIATIVSGAILLALNAAVWQQTGTRTLSADFSLYRDILDLSSAIKGELGDDAGDLSATALNDRIKTDTGNVRITEDASLPSTTGECFRCS